MSPPFKITLPLDTEIIGGKSLGACKPPIEHEVVVRFGVHGRAFAFGIRVIAAEQSVLGHVSVRMRKESLVEARLDIRLVDGRHDNSVAEQKFVVSRSFPILRVSDIEAAQNGKSRICVLARKRVVGGHEVVFHADVFLCYLFRRFAEQPGHSALLMAIRFMRAVHAGNRAERTVLDPTRVHIVRYRRGMSADVRAYVRNPVFHAAVYGVADLERERVLVYPDIARPLYGVSVRG